MKNYERAFLFCAGLFFTWGMARAAVWDFQDIRDIGNTDRFAEPAPNDSFLVANLSRFGYQADSIIPIDLGYFRFCMKSSKFIASLGLVILSPVASVAQSDCPTRFDLEGNGIRFEFAGDSTDHEVHRLDTSGAIEIISYPLETGYRSVLKYGIHRLSYANFEGTEIDPKTASQYSFNLSIAELPEPVSDNTWSASTTGVVQGETTTQTVRHVWGEMTSLKLGECTLDAIPVVVSYENETDVRVENAFYLPALGTAITTRIASTGKWSDFAIDYNYYAISAL